MGKYRYIDTDRDFTKYRAHLVRERIDTVALDIEAEFNLHVYGEHFCLLQIHDRREAVLVDPQTVSIEGIGEFFEDRDLLKITYDSASDRSLLFRNHGIRMRGIMDLRPAVELLQYDRRGLGAILEDVLGHQPGPGKKRYQQYNWMRRPIEPGAIEYAIGDVLHLFALKDHLIEKLQTERLLDRYILENQKVQDLDPETGRKPGFLRNNRFRRLPSALQDRLEGLHAIRERYAQELNLPPNSVLPNRILYDLVEERQRLVDQRAPRGVPGDRFAAMVEEMTLT